MKQNHRNEYLDLLFEAVLQLQTTDECYDFFEDLCTVQELRAFSQRLYVAHLLTEKHIYSDIVRLTGASTATISRVSRSLSAGTGGVVTVLDRLIESESETEAQIE